MKLLIVTGLSGAGKTRAMNYLEDTGYYCTDSLPLPLFQNFVDYCRATVPARECVALVADVRSQPSFDELVSVLEGMKKQTDVELKILFLDAPTDIIVRRYKETRRRHPLEVNDQSLESTVTRERELLQPVKRIADYIIDTGSLTPHQLNNEIRRIFAGPQATADLPIRILSFGYKYGLPMEADLVLDVRFLPNPYYVPALRKLTGKDRTVACYVLENDLAGAFLERILDLLEYLLPHYKEEGKQSLTIAIGCTGGRHRSVAVCLALAERLEKRGHNVSCAHRDCGRG